jgi:hypothetical protein
MLGPEICAPAAVKWALTPWPVSGISKPPGTVWTEEVETSRFKAREMTDCAALGKLDKADDCSPAPANDESMSIALKTTRKSFPRRGFIVDVIN